MKPKIVVVGSANTDMVIKVQDLPEPGETVLGGNFIQMWGGKGANQAVAAARLGAEVIFIARLGRDAFGDGSIASYKADGINTEYIVRDDITPSGVALITVNHSGENTIAVAQGANANLSPTDILAADGVIKSANCMLIQLEIPMDAVQTAIKLAVKYQVPVILNPAPAIKLPFGLLEMVDYLTPNETEAALLEGQHSSSNIIEDAYSFKSKLKIKNLIITLGVKGAAIIDYPNKIVPPFSVESVDTTGAGDAFNGALAVALARGDDLLNAVKFSNAAAALATTGSGAQSSLPTALEVDTFLKMKNARI